MKENKGRPSYEPNEKDRGFIIAMVRAGVRQKDIADVVGISVPTLKKHYGEELATASVVAVTQVADTLFNLAVGKAGKPNLAACIYYLKTRGGWVEADKQPSLGKKERQAEEAKEEQAAGPFQPRPTPLKAVKG